MSDAMNEFFGDFPGRPDHHDFWKLSEIVLGMDAMTESTKGFAEAIRMASVDPNSLGYMANQRAGRMAWSDSVRNYAAASWLDGFIAGTRYRGEGR